MTTYLIRYDRDDDGSFDGELTPDVLDVTWQLGMDAPFESVADVAVAQITVRNPDGRYSPETAASTLQAGLALRISALDGLDTYILFVGTVARVEPAPGEYGERQALITAECALRSLLETRVRLDAQLNARADEVINAVLDAVPSRARYLDGAFVVGIPGRAELGQTTTLPEAAALVPRAISTGRSQFAYVGDRWDDGVRAINAVREVMEAERGRFYVSRGGRFTALNRDDLLLFQTPAAAFSDDMHGVEITYGEQRVSRVEVTLRPRRIGGGDDVLWTLGQAQRIPAGRTRRFKARFRGSSGERIGALNVLPPRPYTDYRANTDPAGTGVDVTGVVEFGLVGFSGSTAEMQLTNPGTSDAYLLAGAVIRGRALYAAPPMTVEERDPLSETFYGPRTLVLNLPALTSIEEAEDIARFELFRRAQPRGSANQLTLTGSAHRLTVLGLHLFDIVTLTESQSGHDAAYHIVGMHHRVFNGGATHTVTYTLEPINPAGYWQVSYGRLGESTRLSY